MLNSIIVTRTKSLVEAVPYRHSEIRRTRRLMSIATVVKETTFNQNMKRFFEADEWEFEMLHLDADFEVGQVMTVPDNVALNGM